MSDSAIDQSQSDLKDIQEILRERFPEFCCVRCGNDSFMIRVWQDNTLQPAFTDSRMVEFICNNCGLDERHVVAGLAGQLLPNGRKS
jgi:hypothetical protein